MASTLVLSAAFGYGIKEIWVFVESLRRHYDGDAAMLVSSRGPDELYEYLRSRNIRAIYFDCPYWMVVHIQVGRYVRYEEFLRECPTKYDKILLSDVNDVVFQANPFAALPEGDLLFFLEDPRMTITQCPSNRQWVHQIYGQEGLTKLFNKRISCSGTTIGVHDSILYYIDHLLTQAKPDILKQITDTKGHDQAIHNYLLYTGVLPEIRTVENGEVVYTLYHVPESEIAVTDKGIAVAATGHIPAIVHQYNFKKNADAYVAQAYPRPG
ncbi:MAG TPA: hypothetical protein VE988_24660 [Gemmataceae bacterium]|nr:hypothetical protein [Gemmataceae bacterium]